jgi:predicted transcriptional regulator
MPGSKRQVKKTLSIKVPERAKKELEKLAAQQLTTPSRLGEDAILKYLKAASKAA